MGGSVNRSPAREVTMTGSAAGLAVELFIDQV